MKYAYAAEACALQHVTLDHLLKFYQNTSTYREMADEDWERVYRHDIEDDVEYEGEREAFILWWLTVYYRGRWMLTVGQPHTEPLTVPLKPDSLSTGEWGYWE